jgi:hypothetical protein
MAVHLVVQQTATRVSVTVNLPATEELGGGEGVTENAETATAAAVFSSFSCAAQNDPRLTPEESQSLQLNPLDTIANEEVASATQFGYLCREQGDKVEAIVKNVREEAKDFVDAATEDEDPGQAVQRLLEIAQTVFEVGEDGIGTFNCGRLLVMFYVCYDVCVSYLKRHGVTLIIHFVEQLVSQLIRFLSRTGFFSWLFNTGGWRCLVAIAKTDRYFQGLFHGAVIVTVVAAVLFALPGLKRSLWNYIYD